MQSQESKQSESPSCANLSSLSHDDIIDCLIQSIKEVLARTSKGHLVFFLFFFYFLLFGFFFLFGLKTLFDHLSVLLSHLLPDFYPVFLRLILLLIILGRLPSSLLGQIFEVFLIPFFQSLGCARFALIFRCFVDGFESF